MRQKRLTTRQYYIIWNALEDVSDSTKTMEEFNTNIVGAPVFGTDGGNVSMEEVRDLATYFLALGHDRQKVIADDWSNWQRALNDVDPWNLRVELRDLRYQADF